MSAPGFRYSDRLATSPLPGRDACRRELALGFAVGVGFLLLLLGFAAVTP